MVSPTEGNRGFRKLLSGAAGIMLRSPFPGYVRLPGKGNSNSHGAQGRSTKIISMIKWIRTSKLSIKNSLSEQARVDAVDNVLASSRPLISGEAGRFAQRQRSHPPSNCW